MNSCINQYNVLNGYLLENIPDTIFIMHRDGTVLEIHGANPDILTAPACDLIGANISQTFSKEEVIRHLELYDECIKSGEIRLIEYKLNINNRELFFESKVKALDSERLLTIVRDITQVKMLERESARALQEADDIGKRFEQIAEHVGDFIWEVDSKGVYTYINRAATSILGYTQQEIVGKMSCFDLMPEDERLKLKDIVYKVFARKETIYNIENSAITKDGRRVYVITNGIPILGREGELLGYRGSSRDITEEKIHKEQLQRSEEKYRKLVENLHAGIVIHSPDSSIIFANQQASSILGLTKSQLEGRDAYDPEWRFVNSNGERLDFDEYPVTRVISTGLHIADEVFGVDRPGSNDRVWVQINAFPEFDSKGRLIQIVVTFIDVTEQKRLYQDLLISMHNADESNRMKSAFINNISHEIRTPLNGILGFVEIMMEDEKLKKSMEGELSILYMSSRRLQKTIEDIMEISDLKAGGVIPNIDYFDLCLMLTELVERTTVICSNKSIEVHTQFPQGCNEYILKSDPDLLKNALWQLLDNAVKFTDKGEIVIGFTIDRDWITIFVKDTGKGISREKLGKIYEPFMQEDVSSTRGYQGSGLGLPIAKGTVELLGGRVLVESQSDIGSIFSITLPLTDVATAPEVKSMLDKKIASPALPLILIAEDDDYNFMYIQTILHRAGYATLHAINGLEAVEMCLENKDISLVFMDIKMPVMSGLEAIKKIKELRPNLPLIATTAYVQLGDKQRFLSAGCDDYLAKPMKVSDILGMANKYTL